MTTTNKQCEAKKRHCSRLLVLMCGFVPAIQLRSASPGHISGAELDVKSSKSGDLSQSDLSVNEKVDALQTHLQKIVKLSPRYRISSPWIPLKDGIRLYAELYNVLDEADDQIKEEDLIAIENAKAITEDHFKKGKPLAKMRIVFKNTRNSLDSLPEMRKIEFKLLEWVSPQLDKLSNNWGENRVKLIMLVSRTLSPKNSQSFLKDDWFENGNPTKKLKDFLDTKKEQSLFESDEASKFRAVLFEAVLSKREYFDEFATKNVFVAAFVCGFSSDLQTIKKKNEEIYEFDKEAADFHTFKDFVELDKKHDNPLQLKTFDEITSPKEWVAQFSKNDFGTNAVKAIKKVLDKGSSSDPTTDANFQAKFEEELRKANIIASNIANLEDKIKAVVYDKNTLPELNDKLNRQLKTTNESELKELKNRITKLEHDAKKTDGEGPDFKDEDLKQLAENLRAFYQFGTDFWIGICGCILGFVGIALFVTVY